MISRTSSSISIFSEVQLLLWRLSLQVLQNYFPRISRILLLCFENCWHKFPTIKSPKDLKTKISPLLWAPKKRPLKQMIIFIYYLFINWYPRGSFSEFCGMTKLDEEYNQTERNETYQTILVQDPEVRAEPKDQNLPHSDFLSILRFLRDLLDTLCFRSAKSHFWKSKMFPTSQSLWKMTKENTEPTAW